MSRVVVLGPSPQLRLGDWAALGEGASAVRTAVFIEEQGVPVALEWDAEDAVALHALVVEASGRALATARLLPSRDGEARLGRMAVLPAWRGAGWGRLMLRALRDAARARGDRVLALSAQCHALAFYASEGWVAEGPVYLDAGIEHRTMRLSL